MSSSFQINKQSIFTKDKDVFLNQNTLIIITIGKFHNIVFDVYHRVKMVKH